MNVDLFAGIAVADFPAAQSWYEKLFGGPPAFLPNDKEAVWELADHRFIFIELRPEHAGHAVHTVFFADDDLESFVEGAIARGLAAPKRETYENGVRKATFRDPDGNEIGFGGNPLT